MLIPKVKVDISYVDMNTEELVKDICDTIRTNIMGDGKIFIEETEGYVVRVRTGEINEAAV